MTIRHPFPLDDPDLGRLKSELATSLGRPIEMLTGRPNPDDPDGVLIVEDPDTGEHLDVDPVAVAAVVAAHRRPPSRRQALLEEFDAALPAGKLAVFRRFLVGEVEAEAEARARVDQVRARAATRAPRREGEED